MGMKSRIFKREGMDRLTRDLIRAYLSGGRHLPLPGGTIVEAIKGRNASIRDLLRQMVARGEIWGESFGAVTLYALVRPEEEAIVTALRAAGASALASYAKSRGLCAVGWSSGAEGLGCVYRAVEGRRCIGHSRRLRAIASKVEGGRALEAKPMYIVQLHKGCWLAPGRGNPARTSVKAEAQRYTRAADAKGRLTRERRAWQWCRSLRRAKIEEVWS